MDSTSERATSPHAKLAAAALIVLTLVAALPASVFSTTQIIDARFNLFDVSWESDSALRLQEGQLSGRDYFFTVGPGFQLIHAVGLVMPPGDVGSVLRYLYAGEILLGLGFLAWALSTSGAPLAMQAGALFTWTLLTVVPSPLGGATLKPVAALALVMWAGRWLTSSAPRRIDVVACAILLLSIPLLTLYGFDLGLITFAVLNAVFSTALVAARLFPTALPATRRRALQALIALNLGTAAFVLGLAAIPAWREYLPVSWEIARGYSLTMAVPLDGWRRAGVVLAALIALAGVVAAACIAHRHERRGVACPPATGVLVAGGIFALAFLRYALTRGDVPHVWMAILPTAFLAGCWLPCCLAGGARPALGLVPATLVALGIMFAHPYFAPGWAMRWRARSENIDGRSYAITDAGIADAVDVAAGAAGSSLLVWPQDALLGYFAGKQNANDLVQCYTAHTPALQRRVIAGLERQPAAHVLVPDKQISIEAVPNVARESLIFRHLLENFELAGPPRAAAMLLKRVPVAGRGWQERALQIPAEGLRFDAAKPLEVDVAAERWRLSDFVVLRMAVAPTRFWGVLKPGHVRVRLHFAGGVSNEFFLVPPQDGSVVEYLLPSAGLEEKMFAWMFSPNRNWQSTETFQRIELAWEPIDGLSAAPDWLHVSTLATLERHGVESLETNYMRRFDPQVQRWFQAAGPRPTEP